MRNTLSRSVLPLYSMKILFHARFCFRCENRSQEELNLTKRLDFASIHTLTTDFSHDFFLCINGCADAMENDFFSSANCVFSHPLFYPDGLEGYNNNTNLIFYDFGGISPAIFLLHSKTTDANSFLAEGTLLGKIRGEA